MVLLFCFGILLVFLLGNIFLLNFKSLNKNENFFLAFPVGMALVTLVLFWMGLAKVNLTAENISFVLILIMTVFLIYNRKTPPLKTFLTEIIEFGKKPKFGKKPQDYINLFLILFILGLVIRSLVFNIIWPPLTWDTLSLYDYRAKRFAETKSLAEQILQSGSKEEISYNYSYPLFTSLSHAYVYIFGGVNPMFVYTVFYASLLGIFYSVLRKKIPKTASLLFTSLLAVSPEYIKMSTIAYTNLPYAFFLGVGIIYLNLWFKDQHKDYLLLSALLTGLSTWVRSQEPFWIVILLFVFGFALVKKKIMSFLIYFFIVFSIREPWILYSNQVIKILQKEGQVFPESVFKLDFSKVSPALIYIYKNVILNRITAVTLFVSSVSYALAGQKFKSNILFFLIIFSILGFILAGTYFLSINFVWWDLIGDSLTRMSMFIVILFYYYAGTVFFDEKNNFKKQK